MSDINTTTTTSAAASNETVIRYPSLASLRAAHSKLLKTFQDDGDDPKLLDRIEEFVRQAQATGAVLDIDDDRWTTQSLLDYWTATLYRAHRTPPDSVLASFDPMLAPELKDENCPYLGLNAFREDKKGYFFGRQRLVDEMVAQLQSRAAGERLLSVVGPSGSGKSSLVLAGLVPALKGGTLPGSDKWCYYPPLYPGAHPLANLAAVIKPLKEKTADWTSYQVEGFRKSESHLLNLVREQAKRPAVIVVDQFEEIFTLCQDDGERQAFASNLLALLEDQEFGHTLVLTMRSDFEEQIPLLPSLQPIFEKSQVRVTPLSASDLREAIEKSAELAGLKFEEGIVDELIKDILGEPAGLPLLQFTLLKLWEKRERNRVTWEAYRNLGGARQALARSADALYESLIPEEQVTAKRILMRLVRPGAGREEVTSNRLQRKELYAGAEASDRIDRVLDRFIKARLLRETPGETRETSQVEVAHEALVRNWPRLVGWLEDKRIAMRQRLRLTAAAELWRTHGKDPGGLLGGSLLEEARNYDDLNELETEFVEASREFVERAEREKEEAHQRELTQAKERAEEQARAARHFRRLAAVLALVFLLAVGGFLMAVYQGRKANSEARKAKARQLDAQALGYLSNQTDLALLLGIEAYNIGKTEDQNVYGCLLKGLQFSPYLKRIMRSHTSGVNAVAYSPNGKMLASGGVDARIILSEAATGKMIRTLTTGKLPVLSLAFNKEGTILAVGTLNREDQTLAVGADRPTIILWDASTGQQLNQVQMFNDGRSVRSIAISPDGKTLAAGLSNRKPKMGKIILWDISDPQRPVRSKELDAPGVVDVNSLAFSPDGQFLASGNEPTAATNESTAPQTDSGDAASASETAATSSTSESEPKPGKSNPLILWDMRTQKPLHYLSGHTELVTSVAFSPDGLTLASGSWDNTVMFWDTKSGESRGQLTGYEEGVSSVAFSPNGRILASGDGSGAILLWQTNGDVRTRQRLSLKGHGGSVQGLSFSADSRMVASGSSDNTVLVWDLEMERPFDRQLVDQQAITPNDLRTIYSIAYSPDGTRMVTSRSSEITVWDTATNQVKHRMGGDNQRVINVAMGSDGKTLAAGAEEVYLYDIQEGKQIAKLSGVVKERAAEERVPKQAINDNKVLGVAISPDNRMVVAGSKANNILVWEMATGNRLEPFAGHTQGVLSVAFSPDGKTLASGGYDGNVWIWNVDKRKLIGKLEPVGKLEGLPERVLSVAFSPDGKRIASGSADSTVRLWSLDGRYKPLALTGHSNKVSSVSFSRDGRVLASASFDGTVILWDVGTGERLGQLTPHQNVASTIFGEETGSNGGPQTQPIESLNSVAFSPDGNTLAGGTTNYIILLWEMNVESWIERACGIANRNLTPVEWKNYMGDYFTYRPTCKNLPLPPGAQSSAR